MITRAFVQRTKGRSTLYFVHKTRSCTVTIKNCHHCRFLAHFGLTNSSTFSKVVENWCHEPFKFTFCAGVEDILFKWIIPFPPNISRKNEREPLKNISLFVLKQKIMLTYFKSPLSLSMSFENFWKLLVKKLSLQLIKSNTPPWLFFRFLNCTKVPNRGNHLK